MVPADELLDRGVPDRVDTAGLPTVPAAELDHLAGRTDRWVAGGDGVPAALRARALVVAGRPDEAREALDAALAEPPTPQRVAAAVWASSRVGEPRHIEELEPELDALPRPFLLDDDVPLAPTAVLEGLLAASRGDLDRAAARLRDGVAEGDRRAPVWGAIARLELARVLASVRDDMAARGEQADDVEAERSGVLSAALMCFTAAGYRHMRSCAEDLSAGGSGIPSSDSDSGVAAPGRGLMVPSEDVSEWRVGFGVQPAVSVGDSLGLRVLHHLLLHAGRRVSVVELDRVASGEEPEPILAEDFAATDGAAARGAESLREELLDDRARTRVSKLIRRTIDRLGQAHVLAGRHLHACVSTGWACSYDPPAVNRWVLTR